MYGNIFPTIEADYLFKKEQRNKYVNTQVWKTGGGGFAFPETQLPRYSNRKNTGIAISGGGTRSASAALGQLRALNNLGLLEKAKYLSCVSGGSWTACPFAFLPEDWDDDVFLGEVVDPSNLTLAKLEEAPKGSMARAISNTIIVDDFLEHMLKGAGDEIYSRAVGDLFLKPFKIGSFARFFTHDRAEARNIAAANPDYGMHESDFYTMNQEANRPYFIAGATVLRLSNKDKRKKKFHFELTPLYVGASGYHTNAGSERRDIGGGYVEPFGFDTDSPTKEVPGGGRFRCRLGKKQHIFTLSDVVGTSGAAPAEYIAKHTRWSLGFPEFKYWAPGAPLGSKSSKAKEYDFGDGGLLENLGIMPLLRRKVQKIIVFVNTKHAIHDKEVNNSIPPLFQSVKGFDVNIVFEDGENKLQELIDSLNTQKQMGRTVMHRAAYRVLDNPLYDIEGGWDVEMLWFYNERVADWEFDLPESVRDSIDAGEFGNFPHYKTFFENPPRAIDLSREQVNMLAHLSCWNVLENQNAVMAMFQ